MRKILPFIAALAMLALPACAATYYVRTDGAAPPTCNGSADAPASATPNCAWSNPQYAIPPGFTGDGAKPPRIAAGDTLIIASGSYAFGYGTAGAEACQTNYTYNCVLHGQLPDNITIKGQSCSAPPELWGSGHIYDVLDLSGTNGLTVSCLDITDHALCIDDYRPVANNGNVVACPKNYPAGDSAQIGILIQGATNLTLADLNIHGLASTGILSGRLAGTTTFKNVTVRANGWSGWNGDLGGSQSSSNSGTIKLDHVIVAWNGCTEAYPATTIVGCWGAEQGGYGDGVGMAGTGGTWIITNSVFSHNSSDGLDLLYADGSGSITIDHVQAFGNAGNQIKTAGTATITNSVVIGNCDALSSFPNMAGDNCRAGGGAIAAEVAVPAQTVTMSFNTITGNGDCLIQGGTDKSIPTAATQIYQYDNNIFVGQVSYLPRNDGGYTCLGWYGDGSPNPTVVTHNNDIVWHVRNFDFATQGVIHEDPLLKNETLQAFDPTLLPNSPAIGANSGARPEPVQ